MPTIRLPRWWSSLRATYTTRSSFYSSKTRFLVSLFGTTTFQEKQCCNDPHSTAMEGNAENLHLSKNYLKNGQLFL